MMNRPRYILVSESNFKSTRYRNFESTIASGQKRPYFINKRLLTLAVFLKQAFSRQIVSLEHV